MADSVVSVKRATRAMDATFHRKVRLAWDNTFNYLLYPILTRHPSNLLELPDAIKIPLPTP